MTFHPARLCVLIVAAWAFQHGLLAAQGLVWDATRKEYSAARGDTNAVVRFFYTNSASSEVVVTATKTSCHCTLLRGFETPKRIQPGERGELAVDVEIGLKWGALDKTITIESPTGTNVLELLVRLPEPTAREKNQQAAFVDRQAVFKGDCAQCHAAPVANKMGAELYKAGCAICHDGQHRAEMVPDLRSLATPASSIYWKQWIEMGKPGSFMPGFHKRYGGPLSDAQVASLATYLAETYGHRAKIPGKVRLPLD